MGEYSTRSLYRYCGASQWRDWNVVKRMFCKRTSFVIMSTVCSRSRLLHVATVWLHATSLPPGAAPGREGSHQCLLLLPALQGPVQRHVRRHTPPPLRRRPQAPRSPRQSTEHVRRDPGQSLRSVHVCCCQSSFLGGGLPRRWSLIPWYQFSHDFTLIPVYTINCLHFPLSSVKLLH